jgi:hypothetical protein
MQVSRALAARIIDEQISRLIDSQMGTRGVWGDTKRNIFLYQLNQIGDELRFSRLLPTRPSSSMNPPRFSDLLDIDWGNLVGNNRPVVDISRLMTMLYGPEDSTPLCSICGARFGNCGHTRVPSAERRTLVPRGRAVGRSTDMAQDALREHVAARIAAACGNLIGSSVTPAAMDRVQQVVRDLLESLRVEGHISNTYAGLEEMQEVVIREAYNDWRRNNTPVGLGIANLPAADRLEPMDQNGDQFVVGVDRAMGPDSSVLRISGEASEEDIRRVRREWERLVQQPIDPGATVNIPVSDRALEFIFDAPVPETEEQRQQRLVQTRMQLAQAQALARAVARGEEPGRRAGAALVGIDETTDSTFAHLPIRGIQRDLSMIDDAWGSENPEVITFPIGKPKRVIEP